MNGWGWVFWGYGIVIGAFAVYVWTLAARTRALRNRLDDLS